MMFFPSRIILKTKDGSQLIEVTYTVYTVNKYWDAIITNYSNSSQSICQSEHISAIKGEIPIRATFLR